MTLSREYNVINKKQEDREDQEEQEEQEEIIAAIDKICSLERIDYYISVINKKDEILIKNIE